MQSLINEINKINQSLIVDLSGTYKYYGLCKEVKRLEEKQNLDIETETQVILDDNFDSFFYHKIAGSETYNKDPHSPGKTNNYFVKSNINLIGYSKFNNFDDHLRNRLAKIKLLTLNSTDYDVYKIIANETARKDFDFNKYLFVINYQLLYKLDICKDSCQY